MSRQVWYNPSRDKTNEQANLEKLSTITCAPNLNAHFIPASFLKGQKQASINKRQCIFRVGKVIIGQKNCQKKEIARAINSLKRENTGYPNLAEFEITPRRPKSLAGLFLLEKI